jgi:hypothetical protein
LRTGALINGTSVSVDRAVPNPSCTVRLQCGWSQSEAKNVTFCIESAAIFGAVVFNFRIRYVDVRAGVAHIKNAPVVYRVVVGERTIDGLDVPGISVGPNNSAVSWCGVAVENTIF